MTGRDLVSASLRKIGAIASGDTLDSQEATDGLAELNRMLGTWSNEGLMIPAVSEEAPITLVSGQASYTLGPSGDLTTRPLSIEKAVIRDGTMDYPPMRILTLDEFAAIPDKSVQSTIPYALYDAGGFPERTITLYPEPSEAKELVLWTKRALSSVALDTTISLPPGYEDTLVYNLAIRLAPEYGRAVSQEVATAATESKNALRRANYKPRLLQCDLAVAGGRSCSIYSGGS